MLINCFGGILSIKACSLGIFSRSVYFMLDFVYDSPLRTRYLAKS